MHFRAQMIVRLRTPLDVYEPDGSSSGEKVTGYIINIWVNANDIVDATTLAQEVALCPKDANGTTTAYDGYVEEAEIAAIEKNDLDEEILVGASNLDQRGVYCSSGLIWFNHDADEQTKCTSRWWQFWKK